MKRLLFIHHATGWGGAPKSMINLITGLDKNNFDIEVLLLKKSIVADILEEKGIKYYIANSWFYKKYYHYFNHSEAGYVKWYQIYQFSIKMILWLMSRFYFAGKELSRFQFDICHLNSSVLSDWLKPCSKKGKVVIQIREPFRNGKNDVIHPFFAGQMRKYADRIIAISKDNAKRIGLTEKTGVIYNFSGIPEYEVPENSYHSKRVLYLGGAAQIKGFYTMVEALDYIDKDVKVFFGGEYKVKNSSRHNIKKILKFDFYEGAKKKKAIQKLKNHPNAEIIGFTYKIDEYLDEACCLVSPFTISHFSRPVIEAYMHKKPAIGSDVSSMSEIIEHNVTGLLFEKENAQELAHTINYLANNPKKARIMGVNAHSVSIKKFSPENILQYNKVYNSL